MSVFGVVHSRVLRVRALIDAGLMNSAASFLVQLLEGTGLPSLPTEEPSVPPLLPSATSDATAAPEDGATPSSNTSTNPPPSGYLYHNHLPPSAAANRPFLSYLLADQRVTARAPLIRACYGEYLWCEVQLLKAYFLTRVGACQDLFGASEVMSLFFCSVAKLCVVVCLSVSLW